MTDVKASPLSLAPKDKLPKATHNSFYSDFDSRFNSSSVRLATLAEIIPFAPRVYVLGDQYDSTFYCAPMEFYLMKNLKNRFHGFKCDDLGHQPSITKECATMEIPIGISIIADELCVLRHGHSLFQDAFKSLSVDLSLVLRFVFKLGVSNLARDGVTTLRTMGTRIDLGCAGSDNERLPSGKWRPALLCGTSIFDKLEEPERKQIKRCLANVYDCMTTAMDCVQIYLDEPLLFNFKPRVDLYAKELRKFLGASKMRNEWITIQVKCLSRGDTTTQHLDDKNCPWMYYDKTGALCFMVVDGKDVLWSLKYILTGRHLIRTYMNLQYGMPKLTNKVTIHLMKLNQAYEELYKSTNSSKHVTWKNPWDFMLNDNLPWIDKYDTKVVSIVKSVIELPTICVRDFWISPAVDILTRLQ